MPGDGREQTTAHLEIASALMKNGADVDALGEGPNLGTCTPLTIAAWGGHSDLIRLLLQHGADVNGGPTSFQDIRFTPPLARPFGSGETLIQAGAKFQLCELVMAGLNDRVKDQLEQDPALVNQLNEDGSTLLHSALQTKSSTVVLPLLLDFGADTSKRDAVGRTPLQLAIEQTIWWDQSTTISRLRAVDASIDVFTAAGLGDATTLREMIAKDPAIVKRDKRRWNDTIVLCCCLWQCGDRKITS